MKWIRSILLFYILCMTYLAILAMKPNSIMGWILSVLWVASIIGLYVIKPKQK